jgi:Holliday junction resolvase
MTNQPVKQQMTTGEDISMRIRHRWWGWNIPGTDIDDIPFIESDHKKAVMLIEYKKENAPEVYRTDSQIQVLQDVADRAGLPFFVVRYARDYSWIIVKPINQIAYKTIPNWNGKEFTEIQFVAWLYRIRHRDQEAENKLKFGIRFGEAPWNGPDMEIK